MKKEPNKTSQKKSSFGIRKSVDVINIRLDTDKRERFHFSLYVKFLQKKETCKRVHLALFEIVKN